MQSRCQQVVTMIQKMPLTDLIATKNVLRAAHRVPGEAFPALSDQFPINVSAIILALRSLEQGVTAEVKLAHSKEGKVGIDEIQSRYCQLLAECDAPSLLQGDLQYRLKFMADLFEDERYRSDSWIINLVLPLKMLLNSVRALRYQLYDQAESLKLADQEVLRLKAEHPGFQDAQQSLQANAVRQAELRREIKLSSHESCSNQKQLLARLNQDREHLIGQVRVIEQELKLPELYKRAALSQRKNMEVVEQEEARTWAAFQMQMQQVEQTQAQRAYCTQIIQELNAACASCQNELERRILAELEKSHAFTLAARVQCTDLANVSGYANLAKEVTRICQTMPTPDFEFSKRCQKALLQYHGLMQLQAALTPSPAPAEQKLQAFAEQFQIYKPLFMAKETPLMHFVKQVLRLLGLAQCLPRESAGERLVSQVEATFFLAKKPRQSMREKNMKQQVGHQPTTLRR